MHKNFANKSKRHSVFPGKTECPSQMSFNFRFYLSLVRNIARNIQPCTGQMHVTALSVLTADNSWLHPSLGHGVTSPSRTCFKISKFFSFSFILLIHSLCPR